ncbi:hypothetical protein HOF56_00540 [Candidatus Peribacteria bacterium]|jgi:Na+/H+ antiporter NhaC|nr:hypothetical protein [Candidatus Peribacteria bacterium]MBT4240568.1 hypothetical protein [Candidatus Peribacteria bacterium]
MTLLILLIWIVVIIFWYIAAAMCPYIAERKNLDRNNAKCNGIYGGYFAMIYYLFRQPQNTKNWNIKRSWKTLFVFIITVVVSFLIPWLLIYMF